MELEETLIRVFDEKLIVIVKKYGIDAIQIQNEKAALDN